MADGLRSSYKSNGGSSLTDPDSDLDLDLDPSPDPDRFFAEIVFPFALAGFLRLTLEISWHSHSCYLVAMLEVEPGHLVCSPPSLQPVRERGRAHRRAHHHQEQEMDFFV